MLLKTKIYAAYGPNLNMAIMTNLTNNCLNSKLLGVGVIKGYELLFKFEDDKYNALATIEPESKFDVMVSLWELSESDEDTLDSVANFPTTYRKEIVTVTRLEHVLEEVEETEEVEAMIYVLTGGELGFPSNHYYKLIEDGYWDNNFYVSNLDLAVRKSQTRR